MASVQNGGTSPGCFSFDGSWVLSYTVYTMRKLLLALQRATLDRMQNVPQLLLTLTCKATFSKPVILFSFLVTVRCAYTPLQHTLCYRNTCWKTRHRHTQRLVEAKFRSVALHAVVSFWIPKWEEQLLSISLRSIARVSCHLPSTLLSNQEYCAKVSLIHEWIVRCLVRLERALGGA